MYIIEAPADIQFHEVPSSTELGDEFRDEGEGIFVLDGYGIQHAIVLDQLEQAMRWGQGCSLPFCCQVPSILE